jgi:hypothetical protein
MFFKINNNSYLNENYLRQSSLLKAYYLIEKYPLLASEQLLDTYIQQQYKISLKNMCVKLLLNLTFHKDKEGNFILLFKDPVLDKAAQIITYGTGAVPGSRILQIALNSQGGTK